MKWNIDDIPIFVKVVELTGFTAAADALGMPKSTVSKAVNRLEDALGLRLLNRNSRNVRVTSEGETFYRQAMLIMEQVREADAVVEGLSATPAGRLVVALPPAFCQEIVSPALATFRRRYPNVDLEIIATTHGADILRDQLDIAVVVGPLNDSELISRSLYSGRLVWVTSPGFLRDNAPGDSPEDLVGNIQICEKRYGLRRMLVRIEGAPAHLDLTRGVTHVNDPLSVRAAVLAGAGISLLPELYCRQHMLQGELVEVYEHISFDLSSSVLSVVYPSRRLLSPTTRAFLEFLDEVCSP